MVLSLAVVAHLVERQPSKLQVAGSRPVYRSNEKTRIIRCAFYVFIDFFLL